MDPQLIEFAKLHHRTRHFAQRAKERKLKADVELFLALFGTRFHAGNGRYYAFIVRQNLPPRLRKLPIVDRAIGWLMVLNDSNTLITCYFNERQCKRIRRAA